MHVCGPFLHGPDITGRGDLCCLHPTLLALLGRVSPGSAGQALGAPWSPETLPSSLCWECVSPGSAGQALGMPQSPETLPSSFCWGVCPLDQPARPRVRPGHQRLQSQSCEYHSARYSLGEVRQGAKQTETRASSPDTSPEQRDPILTAQSLLTDRKSAFQLRPAPGGGLWPRLLGAVHTDSDPQHLPLTLSPPSRAGSVRARGRQSPPLARSLHYSPRYVGASGRRAVFCREGHSPGAGDSAAPAAPWLALVAGLFLQATWTRDPF